jgi:hypothetical protein
MRDLGWFGRMRRLNPLIYNLRVRASVMWLFWVCGVHQSGSNFWSSLLKNPSQFNFCQIVSQQVLTRKISTVLLTLICHDTSNYIIHGFEFIICFQFTCRTNLKQICDSANFLRNFRPPRVLLLGLSISFLPRQLNFWQISFANLLMTGFNHCQCNILLEPYLKALLFFCLCLSRSFWRKKKIHVLLFADNIYYHFLTHLLSRDFPFE